MVVAKWYKYRKPDFEDEDHVIEPELTESVCAGPNGVDNYSYKSSEKEKPMEWSETEKL